MTYTVYFEIYGKKMKATVDAKTKSAAIDAIVSKIIFHKIEKDEDAAVDFLKSMFGMK